MRLVGRLHEWNDARGFGFVTPNGGGDRAFVHMRAFERPVRRPVDGDLLSYALTQDARGRRNAAVVRFVNVPDPALVAPAHAVPFRGTGLATAFAATLVVLGLLRLLPWPVPAGYAAMSALTYFAYLADKSAAVRGRRRTAEQTLHVMALLGGWPGAAFAQQHFQHKRSKPAFVAGFRVTVVLNIAALLAGLVLRSHPQWLP